MIAKANNVLEMDLAQNIYIGILNTQKGKEKLQVGFIGLIGAFAQLASEKLI